MNRMWHKLITVRSRTARNSTSENVASYKPTWRTSTKADLGTCDSHPLLYCLPCEVSNPLAPLFLSTLLLLRLSITLPFLKKIIIFSFFLRLPTLDKSVQLSGKVFSFFYLNPICSPPTTQISVFSFFLAPNTSQKLLSMYQYLNPMASFWTFTRPLCRILYFFSGNSIL